MKTPSNQTYRKLVVWLVAALPMAVVLLGVYYAVAQPGCASCHAKDTEFAQATRDASHASVECVACHVSPKRIDRLSYGFRQLFHMVLPIMEAPGREWAAVADERCLACHKAIEKAPSSANGLRIQHITCAERAACTDCHSTTAHGAATKWVREYSMDGCLKCHVELGSTKCDTCHDDKSEDKRIQTSVFAVTHGKDWLKNHGMGDSASCIVCHQSDKCAKCHGPGLPHDKEFLEKHSTISKDPAAKCSMCHMDSFCADCHGLEMPHTRTFTRNHATRAKIAESLCKRCHEASDCQTCHIKHIHPGGAIDLNTTATVSGGE
ncbi:MAG: hypothetical protein HGB10_03725 [Coriobacteriia bacterium]|nr:hypothetical protein [Coriobacteriia bacterium]